MLPGEAPFHHSVFSLCSLSDALSKEPRELGQKTGSEERGGVMSCEGGDKDTQTMELAVASWASSTFGFGCCKGVWKNREVLSISEEHYSKFLICVNYFIITKRRPLAE